ncbi:hypothetical protein K6W76_33745, partial [Burkholderia anthina]|uniref:FAD-dependent monooxygenase n=1 Tax=Burkholderia anthina TaxID=179879 RepID=UPI0036F29FAE|nr:hypothetical protein [Burkholderia anthina]
MKRTPIAVLGAGPAGAAAALGLARLGYPVTVVSEWRHFDAVEGVSGRVLQGLRHAGLVQAAAGGGAPGAGPGRGGRGPPPRENAPPMGPPPRGAAGGPPGPP